MSLKIDNAIEEIERALAGNKPKYANDIYLNNAIRYLQEIKSPSLTDDQLVVLDYLKKMCPTKLGVSAMVTVYCLVDDNINDNWQEYSDEIPEHIEALQKLSVAEENQVLAAFAEWGILTEEGEG